jgi:hypothetical protein
VLLNWLHGEYYGESFRGHLLRRKKRIYAKKLKRIADLHRFIQFTPNPEHWTLWALLIGG